MWIAYIQIVRTRRKPLQKCLQEVWKVVARKKWRHLKRVVWKSSQFPIIENLQFQVMIAVWKIASPTLLESKVLPIACKATGVTLKWMQSKYKQFTVFPNLILNYGQKSAALDSIIKAILEIIGIVRRRSETLTIFLQSMNSILLWRKCYVFIFGLWLGSIFFSFFALFYTSGSG